MAEFQVVYAKTGKIEGGYANNPNDRGGETYAGISRKFNPSWNGWSIVDIQKTQANFPANLASDSRLPPLVESFFKTNYWDALSLGHVANQQIANELYDIAVNSGVPIAAKFLQRALNIANLRGKAWPELQVDGQVGPATINTLNQASAWEIFKLIGALQGAHYIDIVEKDPTQEEFIKSWMSRFFSW